MLFDDSKIILCKCIRGKDSNGRLRNECNAGES